MDVAASGSVAFVGVVAVLGVIDVAAWGSIARLGVIAVLGVEDVAACTLLGRRQREAGREAVDFWAVAGGVAEGASSRRWNSAAPKAS
mmetsp:Transcript_24872/g.68301  ORF Transcript_24872/g.68301 Transcript_24872/m.68301 type:complete len:88 (+) Transcript_24872:327-590(+)